MNKLFLTLFLLTFLCDLRAQTLRDRIKEKLRERSAPSNNSVKTITVNGEARKYILHVPSKYKNGTSTALIVAFHGGGGSMDQTATDKNYNLISKSDKEGFIIVFPNGTSKWDSGKLATWNAGLCCGTASAKKIDDVSFIRELVNKISSEYSIDKNKIFATGMSNGGMMSYRLACEMSDVFRAIASVAGTDNTIECRPKNPISILHIHSKNDDHVLYNGGAGKGSLFKSMVNDFTSVPVTINKWTRLNACQEKSEKVLQVEGAYCELYSGCKDNIHVKLCVTERGGHSWPGGVKDRGQERPSSSLSATDMMWDFFTGVYR